MISHLVTHKLAACTVVPAILSAAALSAAPLDVASYSYSKAPADNYPDPDLAKLTDGEIVQNSYWESGSGMDSPLGAEVGWLQNPADPETPHPAIIFDLGEAKYIDAISINHVLWKGAGVHAPNEVRVSYSMDGETFLLEDPHTGFDGSEHPDGYTIFTRDFEVDAAGQAARYVRLDFRQGPGDAWGDNRSSWHWLDEVSFDGRDIDDLNAPAEASIYTAVEVEIPTEPGQIYQLESSADLEEWETVGNPLLGDGEVYRIFRTTRDSDRRFFRVLTAE